LHGLDGFGWIGLGELDGVLVLIGLNDIICYWIALDGLIWIGLCGLKELN